MTQLTINDLPIWLINLPSSADRREAMQDRLAALGLDYTYFEAVNGKADWDTLKETVDIPAFERNVGRPVMPGEIGCYHSHLGVWRALSTMDAPAALVLEDDVVFHDQFPEAVNAALTAIDDWDILKLNHIRAKMPIKRRDLGAWHCAEFLGPLTGTGAYLITRKTAQTFATTLLPIRRPIDHEIDRSFAHKINHFGLVPFPSHVEDGGSSTITGTNHGAVKKYPPLQRLPVYFGRMRNLLRKSLYALRRRPTSGKR